MSNVSLSESQSVVFSVVVKSFVIGVVVGTAEAVTAALLSMSMNSEPWFTMELTLMSPFSKVANRLACNSPKPMPGVPELMALLARKKLVNSFFCSLGEMPIPVSLTIICTLSASAFTSMLIFPPAGVYLRALDRRLVSIRSSNLLSAHTPNWQSMLLACNVFCCCWQSG